MVALTGTPLCAANMATPSTSVHFTSRLWGLVKKAETGRCWCGELRLCRGERSARRDASELLQFPGNAFV